MSGFQTTGPAPTIVATGAGPVECAMAGNGPALLAVHGGMGGHDQSWLLARALLGDPLGHRIVAVSRPGYLGTPLSLGAGPEAQAAVLAALLDALGIPSVAVAAVSAGGPSALVFAARFPDRCRALVLVSACTGRLETPPEVLGRMRPMRVLASVPGLPALLQWRSQRDAEVAAARAIRDPEVRARTLRHPEAGPLLRALQASVFDRLARRLPGTANDIAQFARLPQLSDRAIAAPTLLVHGEADTIVPFHHAEAVRQRVPAAQLLAIPGGEHVALFTHLEPVRQAAAPFLR